MKRLFDLVFHNISILVQNCRNFMRKNKSFSSIELNKGVNLANSPQQFRQINKNSLLNITKPDKALKKDKSFSDSEESESSSCVEKKYYRCGCLNHAQECGLRYHDYLS